MSVMVMTLSPSHAVEVFFFCFGMFQALDNFFTLTVLKMAVVTCITNDSAAYA